MITTQIRVRLRITSPWAVGGTANIREEIDLPIQIDPRDQKPHLPGSSLTGSLRDHLGGQASDWLGPDPGEFGVSTDELNREKSRLRVLGTVLSGNTTVSLYGRTAIDQTRKAADAGTLRVEQRVEADPSHPTEVAVYLDHDGDLDMELLDVFAGWHPVIGRHRTSGLGTGSVLEVTAFRVDLSQRDSLTWWLAERSNWYDGGDPPAFVQATTKAGVESGLPSVIDSSWTVRDPVHVGSGRSSAATIADGEDVNEMTLAEMRGSSDGPVIPGTSWKGLFRHRIERILTLCGAQESLKTDVRDVLFGLSGTRDGDGGRGLLRFEDSRFGATAPIVQRSHVAIDRFTGGARKGALFTMKAVEEGAAFKLVIHSERTVPESLLNLVYHAVRDLHEGWAGIGHGAGRGYGRVEATDATILPAITSVVLEDIERALAGLAEQES